MRRPDPIEVYALGHYEQMLLARAVMVSTDISAAPLTDKEKSDLRDLVNIFAQPGVLVITKEAAL